MILQRGGLIRFPEQKHIELLGHPDRLPRNPSTIYSEEFDNPNGLPSPWYIGSETGTYIYDYNTTYPSHFYVRLASGATSYVQLYHDTFLPGDNFSVTMCGYSFNRLNASYLQLRMQDVDTNYQTYIDVCCTGTYDYIRARYYTSSDGLVANYICHRPFKSYLHMQKSGTTTDFWWSTDGLSWRKVGSRTQTFSPTRVRLACVNTSATANGYASYGIDWVRRDWISLP
jgi:hypothetical protein